MSRLNRRYDPSGDCKPRGPIAELFVFLQLEQLLPEQSPVPFGRRKTCNLRSHTLVVDAHLACTDAEELFGLFVQQIVRFVHYNQVICNDVEVDIAAVLDNFFVICE